MSDRYKVLGQATGESALELVAVPVAGKTAIDPSGANITVSPQAASSFTQVLVLSIFACEMSGSLTDTIYDVYIDTADSSSNTYLFKARFLGKNATDILDLNLTLAPGDKVYVHPTSAAGTANVNFTAFGIEMVTGVGPIG